MAVGQGNSGGTVEFRIHGIGNQPPWHALGTPQVIPTESNRYVTAYAPPTVSGGVWLLNWARTSRKIAGFAWFLSLPFTLVNVAGHMRPAANQQPVARAVVTVCVHIASTLVTVSVLVWLVVIAETAMKYMGDWEMRVFASRALTVVLLLILLACLRRWQKRRRSDTPRPASRHTWRSASGSFLGWIGAFTVLVLTMKYVWFDAIPGWFEDRWAWNEEAWPTVYAWVAGIIGGLMALAVVGRRFKFPIPGRGKAQVTLKCTWPTWISYALLFLLSGLFLAFKRPSTWDAPGWLPGWTTEWTTVPVSYNTCVVAQSFDARFSCADKFDPVMTLALVTTLLAVLLALICLALHFSSARLGNNGRRLPNLAGAGLLLVLAVLLVHALASVIRIAVDWLFLYVDRQLVRILNPDSEWENPVAFRVATPTNDNASIYRIDIVVLVASLFVVALAAAVLILMLVAAIRRDGPPPGTSIAHSLVQHLGTTLGPTIGVAVPLFLVLLYLLDMRLDEGDDVSPGLRLLIVIIVQAAALFTALLVAGRLQRVQDALERVADVIGFFRIVHHPLAGASYRPNVLRGIQEAIASSGATRAVLVGHSQGSVLAACVAGRQFEAAKGPPLTCEIRLLTCGSPLISLYASFFPDEFTKEFFTGIQRGPERLWSNCWRSTDPIASRVGAACNILLTDPAEGRKRPLGHADYWTDPGQLQEIENLRTGIATTCAAESHSDLPEPRVAGVIAGGVRQLGSGRTEG